MVQENQKGRVCVTGGTGFLGSWMIKKLLKDGYPVNATVRLDPERERDISFITDLPGASQRQQICHADLDQPDTFIAAIDGCTGVFHMAHPLDIAEKESEEVKIKRVTTVLEGILRACTDTKTVKPVVYNSSISADAFSCRPGSGLIDESSWADVEFIRSLRAFGGPYIVTKILVFLRNLCWILLLCFLHRLLEFICPNIPDTVHISMALFFGDEGHYQHLKDSSFVHVDDVSRAHIHLFEYSKAKGRYIVSAVEFKIEDLYQFISAGYPQFKMPSPNSWKDIPAVKLSGLSTKKLEETGFKYENGLQRKGFP